MPLSFSPLSRSDARNLLRYGVRVSLGGNVLVYQKSEGKPSQASIVVTRGADKRATKRNRIKRCMKEAVGVYLQSNPLSFRGILLIKQPMSTITTITCKQRASGLLEKIIDDKNQRQ